MVGPSWLDLWLVGRSVGVTAGPYRHTLFKSKSPADPAVIVGLRDYVTGAHDDARRYFAAAFRPTLDLAAGAGTPADLYPWGLPTKAKFGSFGECLAALLVTKSGPFGEYDFRIPALLFRFHTAAFDWLMKNRQGAAPAELFGRFGNDVLAFKIDATPKVVEALVVEAKCVSGHRVEALTEAHEQVSDPLRVPVSTYQIVRILQDRAEPGNEELISILQTFMNTGGAGASRVDLVAYTCSSPPTQRETWASTSSPNPSYTGGRRLEVIETYVQDLHDVIDQVYHPPRSE